MAAYGFYVAFTVGLWIFIILLATRAARLW